MSRLTACTYVIAVHDLQASAAYYQRTLGFTVREIGDDGWRIFEKDQCRIMAGQCPDALSPKQLGDHAYFAYLTVDGIDEYYAQVQANGGRILKPLRDEPWGMREFALETIDGHRIMFGGNMPQSQ
jgi:predicted enzyme related to lactoylglutathione lyase